MKNRIVVGLHACREALRIRPHQIKHLYLDESKENIWAKDMLLSQPQFKKIKIYKKRSFLDQLTSGHQGLAVELKTLEPQLNWTALGQKSSSVLITLDEVEDPTNLGNILRTSWLLGVHGILVPKNRSVHLTPHVCKIASGGAEHVPVEEVHPLNQTLEKLKTQGYWVYGLEAQAETTVYDVSWGPKVVLVAGSESKGLRKTTQKSCDQLVKIPQIHSSASLNVATSLAIGLAQIQNSRRHNNSPSGK